MRPRLEQFARGGLEVFESTLGRVQRASAARESHPQEIAHRSATLQRHRQRLFRRDTAPGEAVAGEAHASKLTDDEIAPAIRGDARGAGRMDGRGCARKRREIFRPRSPRSGTRWRCTENSASRVRSARRRCSASATPTTRPTIVARCQTDGKLLADRALSRLLKQDWPRSIDDLTWS